MHSIQELRRRCRVARSIERHLHSWHTSRAVERELPFAQWRRVEVLARRTALARQHQLHAAAQQCQRHLDEEVPQLSRELNESARELRLRGDCPVCPPLKTILEELESLADEFADVQFDLAQKAITVRTERIVLSDIDLGPFAISLKYAELTRPQPYRITAIESFPSATDSDVTHPHVNGSTLCEGDGQSAIRQALLEGRIGDFFMLIRQVLRTYNPSSAYQSLEAWHGTPCTACGDVVNDDDRCDCDRCGTGLCGGCVQSCARCDQIICSDCSTTCEACSDRTCDRCLTPCTHCGNCCCEECLREGCCADCLETPEENDDVEESPPTPVPPAAESPAAEAFAASPDLAVQPDGLGEVALPA